MKDIDDMTKHSRRSLKAVDFDALELKGGDFESDQRKGIAPPPLQKPYPEDAELIDHNENPFLLSSLQGKVALVLFGFTNCEEICSPAMERMRRLRTSNRGEADKMAYVIVSVDGERDTPEVMREYLQKISPDFIGLTGDTATVKPIAANFSASFFKENAGEHSGHYTVSHSPQIFMLDPAGHIRAEMYSASVDAMSGVALALLQEAQE